MLQQQQCVTFRIRGRCMEPVLCDGDRARARKQRWYLPGDILTFRKYNGLLVSHRFTGYAWRRGWKLVVQADDAPTPDALVPPSHVLGRIESVNGAGVSIPLPARLRAVGRFAMAVSRALARKIHVTKAG